MQTTSSTTQKGNKGEELARLYLIKAGYTILEQKWRFKRLEVDLIAKKDNIIVFIEVKARKNADIAEPEVAVHARKQSFLVAAAHHYLTIRDIEAEARFDVVSITGQGDAAEVKHLEAAFFPLAK